MMVVARRIVSSDSISSNILLLLQGFGDTAEDYSKFAMKMALPQTDLVLIEPSYPVPGYADLFSWFTKYDPNGDFKLVREAISRYIHSDILSIFPPERVFMLGFGMGATLGLEVALNLNVKIGGVVAICGGLNQRMHSENEWSRFKSSSSISDSLLLFGVEEYCPPIANFQYVKVKGKGYEMLSSQSEMEFIMRFFAKRLWLRNLGLEKMAVEIKPGICSLEIVEN